MNTYAIVDNEGGSLRANQADVGELRYGLKHFAYDESVVFLVENSKDVSLAVNHYYVLNVIIFAQVFISASVY